MTAETRKPAAVADPLQRAFNLLEHIARENDARAKTCDLLAARGGANAKLHADEARFRRDDARALRALMGTTQKLAHQVIALKTPWWRRALDRLKARARTPEGSKDTT